MEPFDLRNWQGISETDLSTADPLIIDQVVIDSRRIHSKSSLFVALKGEHFDGHDFVRQAARQGARFALVHEEFCLPEPLENLTLIKVQSPLHALQQIASAYRKERKARVIAIAGSYGKTMLKDLLAKILLQKHSLITSPESFNSQIGVALSLLRITDEHEIALIEAGVSKAGEMDQLAKMIAPDHVIITNIGSKRLGASCNLAEEIAKLLSYCKDTNWCIGPEHTLLTDQRLLFWDKLHTEKDDSHFRIHLPDNTRIQGALHEGLSYLIEHTQIASSAAHALQIESFHIEKALSQYTPEPMRIEVFKSPCGATFINDTYSQDPMSCSVALRQMPSTSGKKIFVFGGLRPPFGHIDSDMAHIAQSIAKHKVNLVILSQVETAHRLVAHIHQMSPQTEVIICKDQTRALEALKPILGPDDVVLIKGAKKIALDTLIQTVEDSPPNNQAIINLATIQANIEEIRAKISPQTRIMVMVKALAYGTDDVRVAKFLHSCGIDILGVSYVDEAVALRKAGVTQAIFVLNAAAYEAEKAVKWDLEIGVSEPLLIDAVQKFASQYNKKVRLHLHVDTGMCRFGCRQDKVLSLCQKITSSSHLILEGIMTHFAAADDPSQDSFTLEQAKRLKDAIDLVERSGYSPRWRHACNSSASIRFSFLEFNMIRVGLAAYGLHASSASKQSLELKPAISLLSRIVGINECVKGDSISYGRTHTIEKDHARIAVLPIGYFDGLHRNYSGKGFCLIRGQKAPMVGRICMDYMMVDVSDIKDARLGDPVLLFGQDDNGQYVSPEDLAASGGSIVHELMTCLGPRIRRFFIYDESLRPR